MTIWICTDMEGLAGVDHWDQCYDPDDASPKYLHGREQLTAEANAAIEGCFDARATEVCLLDGHGRNRGHGFIQSKLDPRAKLVRLAGQAPVRWEKLDGSVLGLAMIGQHAMAGTIDGFLDHTQQPKEICRFMINGVEHGEMSMMALYAGHHNVPLIYVSGDEALCEESRRFFPKAVTTPTKRGTGWGTCELYPVEDVRKNMRRDIARAIHSGSRSHSWKLAPPIEITVEWAWSGKADPLAKVPGVKRLNARTVSWKIGDARDIFSWPGRGWQPLR